jgi:hypothetical protein
MVSRLVRRINIDMLILMTKIAFLRRLVTYPYDLGVAVEGLKSLILLS